MIDFHITKSQWPCYLEYDQNVSSLNLTDDIIVIHALEKPFTSHAGAPILIKESILVEYYLM